MKFSDTNARSILASPIEDLEHFLDEDGMIDESGKEVPQGTFLTAIVESVTENNQLPLVIADAECFAIHKGEMCEGEIEAWIGAESDCIGWECTKCGDTGFVSNWQGGRWDKRDLVRH
jgi:hypothetical protein